MAEEEEDQAYLMVELVVQVVVALVARTVRLE